MILTFLQFTWLGTRNRTLQRLRRLRDPRYLLGALAGIAYLWFIFFKNSTRPKVMIAGSDLVVDVLSLVVLIIMILAWALPSDSGGLQFSDAEIAFLFPSPIRRRDLLLYKIIRAQPRALGSAMAFFIFGWRRSFLVGMWAALSVLGIYFTFVALARARLKLMHIGFIARSIIVSAILTALASFAASRIHAAIHMKRYDSKVLTPLFQELFRSPAMRDILFVPRLFATAASAPTLAQLGMGIAGVLAAGAVFFLLAARMNVSFEEASIVTSARRTARMERLRARQGGQMQVSYRRFGPLFRLGETGIPEVAIVWKNVIALVRTAFGIAVLLLLLAVLLLGIAFYQHDEVVYRVIGPLFLMLSSFLPLIGPQFFANDLRLDLARSEILKSYPIVGERLVAAELAAPLCVITALELVFASCASLLMHLSGATDRFVQFVGTPEFIITVLVLTLPVCALLLVIRNAVPLYFPAWTMRSADDVRSFVNVGQRFIILFANLFALIVTLIPAALVAVPTAWIAYKFLRASAMFVPVATVPAAMVIACEVWFGVKMLGARFDEMDVSNEMDLMAV